MNLLELLRTIPGPDFLSIFGWVLFGITLIHALALNLLYSQGSVRVPEPESITPIKSAVLRGNWKHVAQTALFSLYQKNLIALHKADTVIEVSALHSGSLCSITSVVYKYLLNNPRTPEELLNDPSFEKEILPVIKVVTRLHEKLGLIKSTSQFKIHNLLHFFTSLTVVIIGGVKLTMGIFYGKPSIFLLILIIVGLVLQAIVSKNRYTQTPQGVQFLKLQEKRFALLLGSVSEDSEQSRQLFLVSVFGISSVSSIVSLTPFLSSFPTSEGILFFDNTSHSYRSSSLGGCSGGCGTSSGCGGSDSSSGCSSCSSCGGGCGGCGD